MREAYQNFIGIDLGGARGKSTAVTLLRRDGDEAIVEKVLPKSEHGPWNDDALLGFISQYDPRTTAIACNAPLTAPACMRCQLQACPGYVLCEDLATVWLRERGQALQQEAVLSDRSRIASMPTDTSFRIANQAPKSANQRLPPYTQRCTEVKLHFERGILPREHLAQSSWAIASRASFLRRSLRHLQFALNISLLEVSPRCTIHALFGRKRAQGYKRDADPWHTRASIVEGMHDLRFARTSTLSREDVLRNDNCFDSLISGYTAFLWARDNWKMPADGPFEQDGWIWAPPSKN